MERANSARRQSAADDLPESESQDGFAIHHSLFW
jgi:hypothetical protein